MKRPPAIGDAVDRGLTPFRGRKASGLLPKARLGGPLPWVIAVMVAITVVAASGALALSNTVTAARGEVAGSATVQVIEPDADARSRQVEAATEVLAQNPAIAGQGPGDLDELLLSDAKLAGRCLRRHAVQRGLHR